MTCANCSAVVDGRIHDPRDKRERFMATLFLNFAELENDDRRDILYSGKVAKAMRGFAVSPPPAGYVAYKGKWSLDPDERVRLAVSTVIRVFLEQRTLVRTVAALLKMGIQLPRRERHELYWVPPDISNVALILKNQSYVGDYVFRKRRVDPALGRAGNGRNKDRVSRADEMITVPNHHEPYVSRAEWAEIQRVLANNAPRKDRRNPGPGVGLLQGIVRCERHRSMRSQYKKTGKGPCHTYSCQGDIHAGGRPCGVTRGRPLDRAVVAAVSKRIAPPRIDIIRSEWRHEQANAHAEQRRTELELEALRQKAADLERRYMMVDPAHRTVAADLEAQLDVAKQQIRSAESAPSQLRQDDNFSEAMFEDLVKLCGDFERIWNAPTTEVRDKKEILRTLIKYVVVDEQTKERISARIFWTDGTETAIDVPLNGLADRIIQELHAQHVDPTEISERVNTQGIYTLQGNRWTRTAVVNVLWRLRTGRNKRTARCSRSLRAKVPCLQRTRHKMTSTAEQISFHATVDLTIERVRKSSAEFSTERAVLTRRLGNPMNVLCGEGRRSTPCRD